MTEPDNSYISSGNNADLVKVIKQYALFLVKKGETFTKPTSENWTPGALKPIGYSSEDGAVIHPEPGDETEIKAHKRRHRVFGDGRRLLDDPVRRHRMPQEHRRGLSRRRGRHQGRPPCQGRDHAHRVRYRARGPRPVRQPDPVLRGESQGLRPRRHDPSCPATCCSSTARSSASRHRTAACSTCGACSPPKPRRTRRTRHPRTVSPVDSSHAGRLMAVTPGMGPLHHRPPHTEKQRNPS